MCLMGKMSETVGKRPLTLALCSRCLPSNEQVIISEVQEQLSPEEVNQAWPPVTIARNAANDLRKGQFP
jgi:hypothetical protein